MANAAALVVLPILTGQDDVPIPSLDEALVSVLPPMLIVAVIGLAAAEIVLRTFGNSLLHEILYVRYAIAVASVGLGRALMSGLTATVFTVYAVLRLGSLAGPENVFGALGFGLIMALVGLAIGLAEGLILALPLAAILGRFRDVT